MVSFSTARAAVLVGAWAFATHVNAQGYYFQNQGDSCAGVGFQYLGCYNAPGGVDPFQYTPGVPTTRDGQGNPSLSYIQFDNNDFTNATTNGNYCSLFCRAHGYKYTGLYNQGCTCGSSLSDSIKSLTPAADSACAIECSGDPTENCGTATGISIYVDTSFQREDSLVPANLATGYQKLGCFYGSNGGPTIPGPNFYQTTVATPDLCFANCADLKLPYARVIRDDANTFRCFCGADFGWGVRAYDDSTDQLCQSKCSDGTSGCTGQDCCGVGNNNAAPVYANPELMGCLAPVIPGFYTAAGSTVPAGAYTCSPTPAFVSARSKYTVSYETAPSLTKTVSFVATVTPAAGAAFVPYGCYAGGASILEAPTLAAPASLPSGRVAVDTCVEYCNAQGASWAALRAPTNAESICICGSDIASSGLGSIERFSTCNKRCSGDQSHFCGPNASDAGGLVYVNTAVATYTNGPWYTGQYNTWTVTPTYGCTGGVTSSAGPTTSVSSTASSITSSPSITSSDTASITSSSTASESISSTTSESASSTASESASSTASGTDSSTLSISESSTSSGSASSTDTNSASSTGSNTESNSSSSTESNTASNTESNTATNTESNSSSSTDTNTASNTGSSSPTSTESNASITSSSTDSASTSSNTADASTNTISTSSQGSDISTDSQSATSSVTDTNTASQSTTAQGTESSSEGQPTTTPNTETGTGSQGTSTQSTDANTSSQSDVSGSSTATTSSTASTTEISGRPTITVTSRVVRSFAAVFDTEQVPDKTGTYVNLTTFDPVTNVSQADRSFVVQYLGCYLFDGVTTPFTEDDSQNFIGDATASGTASGCAGVCAGANFTLSANNQGDCFCGNELKSANLELEPDRSSCSASCLESDIEKCGGGDKLTSPSGALLSVPGNSFFNIIEAVDAAKAVIVVLDENTTTTGTASDSATGSVTNTETTSSPAVTGPGSISTMVSATTSNDSAGTQTSTSSTASSTNGVPGVQDMPGQTIIAGILNDGGAAQAQGSGTNGVNGGSGSVGAVFRVPTGGFLGGEDSPNPVSCSDAIPLNLTSGQLSSGGEFIAAESTDAYTPLAASMMSAAVTTTFSSVDGILHWFNPAFYRGEAGFCQVGSGQVYATFTPASQWPQGCVAISLALYRVEQCQNGTLVDPSLATGTVTSGPTATNSNGGNGSGLATMTSPIPFSEGIFPIDASPTDEACVSTPLSWEIAPEPTFIEAA
ncbi:hypothetical protein PFICI_09910 [Pestalotiopsis fici W106-1]|uniref:WSC domain-containing protein n=1 Tax=Pestalotiopsis fici (strain W106-1 / CGMCC3.15140) TaxID=1229662 RepID=W3WVF0_PESFW|nr:uncharacterized protein PFICI_09910 [Pestalotiopsis fici W106-1]ETS77848.1 hypothetical protein PFICI_09910 [Pestalotiopsis fici W106-1]